MEQNLQPNHLNFEWQLSQASVNNLWNINGVDYYKICAIYYYTESGWVVYTSAQGYNTNNEKVGNSEDPCITPCFAQPSSTSGTAANEVSLEVKLTYQQLDSLKQAEGDVIISGSFEYQGGGTWSMHVVAKAGNALMDEVLCISPC